MSIFDYFEPTGFDRYFSEAGTTITTLLLDENIISELKNQNPQLLQYLDEHKNQFISEMINHVILMPTEQDTHDRAHKLPYISSELLALSSDLIYKEFFQEEQSEVKNPFWLQLFEFLDSDAAKNEVLMGYFEKVIANLYMGSKVKTTAAIAIHLDRFVKNLSSPTVSDILKKCLALHNEPDGVVLQERKKILNQVLRIFTLAKEEDLRSKCADILVEVVNKFQAFSSGQALIDELLSAQAILSIYDIQGSEATNQFLINFIRKTQQRTINEFDQSVPLLKLPKSHAIGLEKYLKRESSRIRDISKSTGFIVNQNKETVRKSSKAMYPLLTLLGFALKDNFHSFVDEGLCSFLWSLTLLYPYNNILHVLIGKIFTGILQCNDVSVKKCFLSNYESFILSLAKQNLTMLRPFIYSIWTQATKYPQVTTDPIVLLQFQTFVAQHLQPLLQHDTHQVKKSTNAPKQLIIDEEDPLYSKKIPQIIQSQILDKKDEEKVDFFQQQKVVEKKEQIVQEKNEKEQEKEWKVTEENEKKQEKVEKEISFEELEKQLGSSGQEIEGRDEHKNPEQASLDFFAVQRSQEVKESQSKKSTFDNFADFF